MKKKQILFNAQYKFRECLILFLLFVFFSTVAFPQENWVKLKDSQSNEYFRDIFGKMHLTGEIKPGRRPVSRDNAEFYYRQAMELIEYPEIFPKIQAIRYWKEILLLPDKNNVHIWRVRAAQALSRYRKIWGDSFLKLEKGIHFYRTENLKEKEFFLHVPGGFITLLYPSKWEHIEFRIQNSKLTRLSAILVGSRFPPLIQVTIAYDRFYHRTRLNVSDYKKLWHKRLNYKKYKRSIAQARLPDSEAELFKYTIPARIKESPNAQYIIDRYTGEKKLAFRKYVGKKIFIGEEHYIRKKNYGYYIAFMTQKGYYEKSKKEFYKILASLKIKP